MYSRNDVIRELISLREFIGSEKRKLMIHLADQGPIGDVLKELGFQIEAMELVGKTDLAVKLLNAKRDLRDSPYLIEPLAMERDYEDTLKVIQASHDYDPSAIRVTQVEGLKSYFAAWSESGTAFVMRDGARIIGEIGIGVKYMRPDLALIGSIAVHPEYQGKGLSHFLYLHGLEKAQQGWYDRFLRVLDNNSCLGKAGKHGSKDSDDYVRTQGLSKLG